MESMGELAVVQTNNTSPLWPKVYFVTRRGLTKLKQALSQMGQQWTKNLKDRRRPAGQSALHVLHELFIAEFLLNVWSATQACKEFEILTMQRRSLARYDAFKVVVAGRPTRLQPDGMFVYRQQGKGMMCCFVEVDTGSMTLKQLTAKFQRYQAWADSANATAFLTGQYASHGANRPTTSFRILMIVGSGEQTASQRRVEQILELLLSFSSALRNRIWLTTVQDINASSESGKMLDRSFWQPCS